MQGNKVRRIHLLSLKGGRAQRVDVFLHYLIFSLALFETHELPWSNPADSPFFNELNGN